MGKIYTKTGDKGYTSLVGGKRVKKNDVSVEAYGTIDEANSTIGLVIAKISEFSTNDLDKLLNMLIQIQKDLFHVGSEISTPKGEQIYWPLENEHISRLENYIDDLDSELSDLKSFILPGGTEISALLHISRTILRRAERLAVEINNDLVNSYLNRCSDFFFTAARWTNMKLNKSDTLL